MPPSTTLEATNAVAQKMELELRQYPEVRSICTPSVGAERHRPNTCRQRRHQSGPDHRAAGAARRAASRVGRARGGRASAISKAATRGRTVASGRAQRLRFRRLWRRADPGAGAGQRSGGRRSTGDPAPADNRRPCPARSDSKTATTTCRPSCGPKSTGRARRTWASTARDAGAALRDGAGRLHVERQPVPPDRPKLDPDPHSDGECRPRRRQDDIAALAGLRAARAWCSSASSPRSSRPGCRRPSPTSTGCAASPSGSAPGRATWWATCRMGSRRRSPRSSCPVGYSVTYAGAGQQGGSAFGDLARAMGMAVLLMYMLMMMLFGSLTCRWRC